MRDKDWFDSLKRLDAWHRISDTFPSLTAPLRLASYSAYRGLELVLGERHPHVRVVEQARRMRKVALDTPFSPGGKKVLIFTVQGWFAHICTEIILAEALRQRDATTTFFMCGGWLSQCDFKPGTDRFVTKPLCLRCSGFAKRLLKVMNFPVTLLRDVVERNAFEKAVAMVEGLEKHALENFVYRDLPVGQYVLASVQRSLLRGDVGNDARSVGTLREFVAGALVMTEASAALLEREKPEVVVLTNGSFFAERIMFESARKIGIDVVTYERGVRSNTVAFSYNSRVIPFDVDLHWPRVKGKKLTADQNRILDGIVSTREKGDTGTIVLWPTISEDRNAVQTESDKPIIGLFTNVLWDSAVFRRDIAFSGMFDWLSETIVLFLKRDDMQLVVRVHPAEIRIPLSESRDRVIDRIHEKFPSLPGNISIISPENPLSSYHLIDRSKLVLTYSSTIGLEAALRGKRVVVSGNTHYREKGFTSDVQDRDSYESVIEQSLQTADLSEKERELSRRYAYLFFVRHNQSFPFFTDVPRGKRCLRFDSLDELSQGRDPDLDRWCKAILEGSSFVDYK